MSDSEARRADVGGGKIAPSDIARRGGVVHRDDNRPGIRRRQAGRGFTYIDKRGRPVKGRRREWIESLAVPPAWTDVWIAPETDSHLLASGIDAAGRKQYVYHPDWMAAADEAKFERLGRFAVPLSELREYVAGLLRRPSDDEWICAAAVRLIDDTLIRPGSFRQSRQNGSVGATTLQAEHVSVSRRRLRLQFEGKGSIEHEIEVSDPLLARRISDLIDRADPDHPLFADDDGQRLGVGRLNRFIAEHAAKDFTAKDLRTWGATSLAAGYLMTNGDVDLADDALVREAIDHAAERLGNTPEVCRSAYIAPRVLEAYHDGHLAEVWRRSRRTRWLSRSEQTVGRLLATSPE